MGTYTIVFNGPVKAPLEDEHHLLATRYGKVHVYRPCEILQFPKDSSALRQYCEIVACSPSRIDLVLIVEGEHSVRTHRNVLFELFFQTQLLHEQLEYGGYVCFRLKEDLAAFYLEIRNTLSQTAIVKLEP